MKKLLVGLLVSVLGFMTYGSAGDSYKKALYDVFLQGKSAQIIDRYNYCRVLGARNTLLVYNQALLPRLNELCTRPFEMHGSHYADDFEFLRFLARNLEYYPHLRPFIKKAYKNMKLKRYKKEHEEGRLYAPFPKKEVIDAYPSSFEPGTVEDIVLGPLLNPGSITKKKYEKQVKNYYRGLSKKIRIFLENRSDVLFPGLAQWLLTIFRELSSDGTIAEDFVTLVEPIRAEFEDVFVPSSEFSKPNKKRDLAVLKAFWKGSIDDERFLPFVEKGYANFKKCYGHSAPVQSLKLKEGLTLGMYADKNKNSNVSKLCHKLEPAPRTFFCKAVIVGILSGIGYVAYKKYTNYKSSEISGGTVDLTAVKG